jgi:predicted cobalt transporter CbtA
MAGIGLSVYALLLIHHSSFCDPSDPWANMVVRWLLAEIFIAFIFFCLIAAISPLLPQDKAASLLQRQSRRVVIVMVVCAVCCGVIVAMF